MTKNLLGNLKKKFASMRDLKWPLRSQLNLKSLKNKFIATPGKLRGRRWRPTWRGFFKGAIWTGGVTLIILIILFAWFAKDLPTPGKIRNLAANGSTRLFDRNMKPLYTISGEKKRIIVEDKDIPENIKQATIALEDKDFYHHIGIDTKGLARAVVFRGSRGGGSTITQQFIKNALLTNQRSLTRKAKEAILAVELEALYSKDQILLMYLNEIPYGGNNYGVEAASRSFFNKPAKDLTLDEAATLAALPQQPTTLSPYGPNTERLKARRNLALERMTEQGYITKDQADEAKKVELHFTAKKESITAPHFVLYVKDWLVQYFTKELGDPQLAEQKVEEGGMTVVTTLDLDKQIIAEDVLSKAAGSTLKNAGASNAGLVSIDPKRGEVISMVGSVDYFQDQFGNFNVTTGSRQPGSSIKPLVYAAAFKEKYNPGYVLYDVETDFNKYKPENFDGGFRGPVTIRQALGNSLNIPAVKTLSLVGLDKALETMKDMGITTLTDKDRYGLALVLGGGEVTPLEMAGAYGTFANQGVFMPTTAVLKITDSKGEVIYDHSEPKDGKQVLDPQIAYEISHILSDTEAKKPVFSRVMGVLTLKDRPVASKTGTTNGYRDAWTIGYTPQFVTAVWAGNNDNTPMNRAGGSVAAAPLWDQYMERIHQGLPVEQFSRPEGIKEVEVDRLSNKLPVDGSEIIKDIFASWQVPTQKDDVHLKLRVCKENGLLADDSASDEIAENRVFTNIHSERPNNPDWENPVIAWARANNLYNPPPKEKCQTNEAKPTVKITSPTNGGEVGSTLNATAEASAASGVRSVAFYIDNVAVSTDTEAPYSFSQSATSLSNGDHTLVATVTSNSGASAQDQITFKVTKDIAAPANVSGLNGIVNGPGSVTLTWTNPTDSDFASVKIYVTLDISQVAVKNVIVLRPGETATITGLTSGLAHRFTAKSLDDNGNESAGVAVVLTP